MYNKGIFNFSIDTLDIIIIIFTVAPICYLVGLVVAPTFVSPLSIIIAGPALFAGLNWRKNKFPRHPLNAAVNTSALGMLGIFFVIFGVLFLISGIFSITSSYQVKIEEPHYLEHRETLLTWGFNISAVGLILIFIGDILNRIRLFLAKRRHRMTTKTPLT